MFRRLVLPFIFALGAQSCLIYDADLLDGARGSNVNPGLGGASGDGDGDGDDVETGGTVGSGGGPSGSGGTNPATGGSDNGTGGLESTGGASSGGSPATGGSDPGTCDTTLGSKGPFSGVASKLILDDFNNEWSLIGAGDRFTGQWNVSSDGTGMDLSPTRTPEANWLYEHEPCFESGDNGLHIQGSGFTGWGAGFDANLMLNGMGTDLDAFVGVVFWARSGEANQIRLAFTDELVAMPIESSLKLLKDEWTQFKVAFPAGIDKSKLKVVHIVVVGTATFDLWFDDLTFYSE